MDKCIDRLMDSVVIILIQSFHYIIVSATSDHHDLQQLHDLVQEKDS